ncbi:hypothetical protein [Streptomyces sp. NPDC096142]|uniref:hypothetical protein n=1 Tax=Streptomyces sp. NPDC096142 TaxID=3366077 RepID=UPI0037FF3B27
MSHPNPAADPPVQCWHTEAGTPCNSDKCNQPERLAAGDYGDVPLDQTAETTTRVFAALHRSAEETVTRVISLYEQWVNAGPPPLGESMARWWDRRLAELHAAINGPVTEPGSPS